MKSKKIWSRHLKSKPEVKGLCPFLWIRNLPFYVSHASFSQKNTQRLYSSSLFITMLQCRPQIWHFPRSCRSSFSQKNTVLKFLHNKVDNIFDKENLVYKMMSQFFYFLYTTKLNFSASCLMSKAWVVWISRPSSQNFINFFQFFPRTIQPGQLKWD